MEIKDSGERREFSTGAVRDMARGKGRFDIASVDIMAKAAVDPVLTALGEFQKDVDPNHLIAALREFIKAEYKTPYEAFLRLAEHHERGLYKYGLDNWKKGIPIVSFFDSSCRHYCEYKSGMRDEPHAEAFMWNVIGAIWTMENKPEMLNKPYEEK